MKFLRRRKKPRVLIVTPEVTYLPEGMGRMANGLKAKAGGLADVSAALIAALFEHGGDVHVALPDYRSIFFHEAGKVFCTEYKTIHKRMPPNRIHLAEDRAFFYRDAIYSSYGWENIKVSLAFQREVINNIIPSVKPDLIHCNDWMTGLLPAKARELGIPCLFTIHNIFTVKMTLAEIEDQGIDAALFWKHLYFQRAPVCYEETRAVNPVDFLTSGVFAAHFINTVSPTFLIEIVEGKHPFIEEPLRRELACKWQAGCATGILNSPDASFNPATDASLPRPYGPSDWATGKAANKRHLQKRLGLLEEERAPLFFWPSRLDRIQKGSPLMTHILYDVVSRYWQMPLEIVFVANGEFQPYLRQIAQQFHLAGRVAVCDFDEDLARLAYAASDFVLMPSAFEPCGLPQMIAPLYGSVPVVRNTGGLHDTIRPLNAAAGAGNGIVFETYDPQGLLWAIDQAVAYYGLPSEVRNEQTTRIMSESLTCFNHAVTAARYIDLYEKMLNRPFLQP
ncbi:MAG: glycosyltransferase [Deltaproteobacteria bacterium]|nr:glycosyltransferase [Deltaproteobacteria bacterium]